MEITKSDQKRIVEWAQERPEIREVWLYGSRARRDSRPDSDIDLAIKMQPAPHGEDSYTIWFFWDQRQELELMLSGEVHLAWYQPNFGPHVVTLGVEHDGILLFSRD